MMSNIRKAYYRRIPCYFDVLTNELKGRNKFYDILVELNIWFDLTILQLEELPIWIEIDDNEVK
jgi:hypothetical protein